MDSKEVIIGKITAEAEEKSQKIAEKAESDVQKLIAAANVYADELKQKLNAEYSAEEVEAVRRRKTVAVLDAKKLVLQAKQEVLTEVFNRAEEKLHNLSKPEYVALCKKLLEENAENGDEVVLSSDGVLSPEDIKGLKVYADKNLTVAKGLGGFIGGLQLVGKICDKDLSFKAIIRAKKDESSAKLAEELFGL